MLADVREENARIRKDNDLLRSDLEFKRGQIKEQAGRLAYLTECFAVLTRIPKRSELYTEARRVLRLISQK